MAGDLSQIKESSRTLLNEEVDIDGAVDHSEDDFAAQGVSMSSATNPKRQHISADPKEQSESDKK